MLRRLMSTGGLAAFVARPTASTDRAGDRHTPAVPSVRLLCAAPPIRPAFARWPSCSSQWSSSCSRSRSSRASGYRPRRRSHRRRPTSRRRRPTRLQPLHWRRCQARHRPPGESVRPGSPSPSVAPAQPATPRPGAPVWTRLRAVDTGARWGYMYPPALWDFDGALFLNPLSGRGRSAVAVRGWRRLASRPPSGTCPELGYRRVRKRYLRRPGIGTLAARQLSKGETQTFEGRAPPRPATASRGAGRPPRAWKATPKARKGVWALRSSAQRTDGYLAFGAALWAHGMDLSRWDAWQPATDPNLKQIARSSVVGLGADQWRSRGVHHASPPPARTDRRPSRIRPRWLAAGRHPGCHVDIRLCSRGQARRATVGHCQHEVTGSASGHRSMALPGAGRARCRTSSRRPRSRSRTQWLVIRGLDISTGCASGRPTIGLTWTLPTAGPGRASGTIRAGVIWRWRGGATRWLASGSERLTHAKVTRCRLDDALSHAPPSAVTSRPTRVPNEAAVPADRSRPRRHASRGQPTRSLSIGRTPSILDRESTAARRPPTPQLLERSASATET